MISGRGLLMVLAGSWWWSEGAGVVSGGESRWRWVDCIVGPGSQSVHESESSECGYSVLEEESRGSQSSE